jgi:hypothetical protein
MTKNTMKSRHKERRAERFRDRSVSFSSPMRRNRETNSMWFDAKYRYILPLNVPTFFVKYHFRKRTIIVGSLRWEPTKKRSLFSRGKRCADGMR